MNQGFVHYIAFGRAGLSLYYRGMWNATTNRPRLQSGQGVKRSYYVVSVAGETELDGINRWSVGDWVWFDGRRWNRLPLRQQPPADPLPPDSYVHHQTEAANEWLVVHDLNRYPSVTVVRDDGVVVCGEVQHLNLNQLRVRFSEPLAGWVRCE